MCFCFLFSKCEEKKALCDDCAIVAFSSLVKVIKLNQTEINKLNFKKRWKNVKNKSGKKTPHSKFSISKHIFSFSVNNERTIFDDNEK